MANALGYYKVHTACEPLEVRDPEAWPYGGRGLIAQWVFIYTERTQEEMRERALEKAREVSRRLGGAGMSGVVKIKGIANAFAIRVGRRIEA